MKIWTLIIAGVCCASTLASSLAESNIDQGLVDLVKAIDEKAETISTIKAKFHQVRESTLMKDPMELRGTFFLKKPDGLKFSAVPSDDLILVITQEEMVSLSPKVKKASRIKLKKRRDFLTQHLLSKRLEAMLGFFTIAKSAKPDAEGNHHLILTPIKRKYKKRFKEIHLWVNADHIIFKFHVMEKDGDVIRLELSDIQVNVPIDSSEFVTTIPNDYTIGERMAFILGSDLGF